MLLTDLPEVLPALRASVELNAPLAPQVSVRALDWHAADRAARDILRHCDALSEQEALPVSSDAPRRLTAAVTTGMETCESPTPSGACGGERDVLVLAADCVWVRALVPPFLATLDALRDSLSGRGGLRVLLAYKSRSAAVDALLFDGLRRSFTVHPVAELAGEQRGTVQLWLAAAR